MGCPFAAGAVHAKSIPRVAFALALRSSPASGAALSVCTDAVFDHAAGPTPFTARIWYVYDVLGVRLVSEYVVALSEILADMSV